MLTRTLVITTTRCIYAHILRIFRVRVCGLFVRVHFRSRERKVHDGTFVPMGHCKCKGPQGQSRRLGSSHSRGQRAETCQPVNRQGFASGPVWVLLCATGPGSDVGLIDSTHQAATMDTNLCRRRRRRVVVGRRRRLARSPGNARKKRKTPR